MIQNLEKHILSLLKNEQKNVLNVLFVRHGQSMGNYAGSIIGWTDSKLTIKGREQSNKLYPALYQHLGKFTQIYSSDLCRCQDTAKIALGFPTKKIKLDPRLRELNFGDDEGKHFDSLPDAQKQIINTMAYKAKNGQSWIDVYKRVQSFYSDLSYGNYLVFSHGGLICTQTFNLGQTDIIGNCSAIGLKINKQKREAQKIIFNWEFPVEQEI